MPSLQSLRGITTNIGGRSYVLPCLILLVGLIMRVGWLSRTGLSYDSLYEAGNVAIAYARTGSLADAYQPGQGPTAHLLPVNLLLAGTVYALLGVRSIAAEVMLSGWSITVVLASFAFLFAAFGELGMPRTVRLFALAILCLLPINVTFETLWFRVWEGGLAVALGAGFLFAILNSDRSEQYFCQRLFPLALLASITFFVSPQIGSAAFLALGLLLLQRFPSHRWIAGGITCVAALAIVLTPWLYAISVQWACQSSSDLISV